MTPAPVTADEQRPPILRELDNGLVCILASLETARARLQNALDRMEPVPEKSGADPQPAARPIGPLLPDLFAHKEMIERELERVHYLLGRFERLV